MLCTLLCLSGFAKTHKTDIATIDTIEYTLEEDDRLSAELYAEEDGLYNVKLTSLSTTGRFPAAISVGVYQKGREIYLLKTGKFQNVDEEFGIERYEFTVGLTEGEYRLEIKNLTKFSDVSFRLETTFTEEENIETIGNHSFEAATEMSLNEKYFGGVVMTDDTDFYRFEMPYDGYAYIQMYSPMAKLFTMYDGAKHEIGSIGIEIDEADKVYELKSGLAKGTYYISVNPDENYSSPLYSLEIEVMEGGGFEKEYNNQKEFATPVVSGKEYIGNLFGTEDEDVFSFTLTEDGSVTVDFTDTVASKDGHYSIYIDDGKRVIYSSDECGRETVPLNLGKGTYYITVSGLGYSRFTSMAYKLKVTGDIPIAICPPEEDAGTEENEPVKEEVAPFDDVKESDWYYGELLQAKKEGLIEGIGENKYNPRGNVTVAEVITMAVRIRNSKGGANTEITSSPVGKWYNSYITFAVNSGIINRDDFDSFERNATRAEVAYIFSNLFDDFETEKNIIIPDVDENTEYCDSIHKLYALGILKGDDENGTFYPERNLSRAEAAIILLRVHNS